MIAKSVDFKTRVGPPSPAIKWSSWSGIGTIFEQVISMFASWMDSLNSIRVNASRRFVASMNASFFCIEQVSAIEYVTGILG